MRNDTNTEVSSVDENDIKTLLIKSFILSLIVNKKSVLMNPNMGKISL